MNYSQVRDRIFEIVDMPKHDDKTSRYFDIFILTLIVANVTAIILETVPFFGSRFSDYFKAFELFSVVVFSIEYLVRLWSCTSAREFRNPVVGRIRFALSIYMLIDLIAILPSYLPLVFTFDLRFVRILRVFRLLKLTRYLKAIDLFKSVFWSRKEQLALSMSLMFLLLILMSCIMFHVENEAQPEVFSDIISTMWWAVAALTTVGYGDAVPVTALGKVLSSLMSILGIAFFALPTAIIGSGFTEIIQKSNTKKVQRCPHCGREIQ
jgi:voltage-gated potassium channel